MNGPPRTTSISHRREMLKLGPRLVDFEIAQTGRGLALFGEPIFVLFGMSVVLEPQMNTIQTVALNGGGTQHCIPSVYTTFNVIIVTSPTTDASFIIYLILSGWRAPKSYQVKYKRHVK